MAYVRKRGRQLAVVHGTRDPDTQKVQQQILFTIYSKGEALEILGRGGDGKGGFRFESLMKGRYPDIRFDWDKIRHGVEDNIDVLPDLYDYRDNRLRAGLRPALLSFTKALVQADPQWNISAAELVEEHRHELEFLAELIEWRLDQSDKQERSEWTADNPFYWRFSLPMKGVPPEAEETATGCFERGELDKAEAAFRLLTEAFHPYAEGHNYLGLIALEREELEVALEHFRTTAELGRKMFPKRIGKTRYWSDHATRPYMRGLRNQAYTLNRLARYDEALAVCDHLDDVCGDDASADVHRAAIYLNMGMWKQAYLKADKWCRIWSDESFIAGFAAAQRNDTARAVAHLVHAALNQPRAARMLAGSRTKGRPKEYDEARDHNAGVSAKESLHGYLARRASRGKKLLRRLLEHSELTNLIAELQEATATWRASRDPDDRTAYDRMMEMQSLPFAEARTAALMEQLEMPRP